MSSYGSISVLPGGNPNFNPKGGVQSSGENFYRYPALVIFQRDEYFALFST